MKTANLRNVLAVLLVAILALSMCTVVAFAEELPVDIPSPDKATVSGETDTATNTDPDMGTKFYMYIPPDVVANDYPQMGDEGIPVSLFLTGAVVSGLAYLGFSAYANKERRSLA